MSASLQLPVGAVSGTELARRPVPALSAAERLALRIGLRVAGRRLWVTEPERLATVPDPTIVALNHNTTLESGWVPMALVACRGGRKLSFLVDWMFLELPVVGWMIRHGGGIPIYNKHARWRLRDAYRQQRRATHDPRAVARDLLAAGQSLVVFPEGKRNRDPRRLLPGRPGLGWLALVSGAPILPVGIARPGTRDQPRIGEWAPMVVQPGQLLQFAEERAAHAAAAAESPARRREAELALARSIVDRTMDAIARLSGKAPARARSLAAGEPSLLLPATPIPGESS